MIKKCEYINIHDIHLVPEGKTTNSAVPTGKGVSDCEWKNERGRGEEKEE